MRNLKDAVMAKLERLSGFRSTVILAVLLVAVAAINVPLRNASERIRADVETKRREIDKARASGLLSLNAEELAGIQFQASSFRRGFISPSQVPAVLDGISDEAQKNNVKVLQIHSEEPIAVGEATAPEGERFNRLPIQMRLQASARSIAIFLRALSSSERLFVVESLSMRKSAPNSALVDCEVTLSFFSNG